MMWGCISSEGCACIEILEKNVRMDSKMYLNILERKLVRFMEIHSCTRFMQDSAPCHVSKLTMGWFNRNRIEVLDWPGNSPDLNPIENVWKVLKSKVSLRNPTNIQELKTAIMNVWCNEITPELCRRCISSMPRRIKAVLDAHGGSTKY